MATRRGERRFVSTLFGLKRLVRQASDLTRREDKKERKEKEGRVSNTKVK